MSDNQASPGCRYGLFAPSWLRLGLVSPLLLLFGCGYLGNWRHNGFKVGPDYQRPAVPVADQWIDFNNPQLISQGQGVEEGAWWTVFADADLDRLVQSAHQQNLTLRVAALRVLEAQSQRAIAAGSLFPQRQEAIAQFQQTQFSRNGNPVGFVIPIRSFGLWTIGFNASWELDLWGRIRRGIESADADLDASVEDYDDVLVSLVSEVATTYVELRAFQSRLEFAQANVETQQNSLKLAEARFENGAVSRLDVTQAQSSLEQTRSLIPVLQRGARQAGNRLCVLTGTPPRDLTGELGWGTLPDLPPQVVVGIPAELIRRRPDVRRAERQVAAQSAQIGIAAAELFPTFSIDGSLNWQANRLGNAFSAAANAGSIAPQFRWNILNYGRIVNNVQAQDARFQQLAVEYQQTVLNANAEAENAIVDFLRTREQADFLQRSVNATSESLAIADTQYKEGAIDFDRVNNLQRQLVTQQDELVATRAEVAINLIRVYRSLGGGWRIRYEEL